MLNRTATRSESVQLNEDPVQRRGLRMSTHKKPDQKEKKTKSLFELSRQIMRRPTHRLNATSSIRDMTVWSTRMRVETVGIIGFACYQPSSSINGVRGVSNRRFAYCWLLGGTSVRYAEQPSMTLNRQKKRFRKPSNRVLTQFFFALAAWCLPVVPDSFPPVDALPS